MPDGLDCTSLVPLTPKDWPDSVYSENRGKV